MAESTAYIGIYIKNGRHGYMGKQGNSVSRHVHSWMKRENNQEAYIYICKHVYRGKGVAVGIGSELMTPFKVVWMPSSRP